MAQRRATNALSELERRAPRNAHRRTGAGYEDVPVESVPVGDEVLVRPGEVVPVNGIVRDGRSHVNTAAITGEPMPVTALPGTRLYSGFLNERIAAAHGGHGPGRAVAIRAHRGARAHGTSEGATAAAGRPLRRLVYAVDPCSRGDRLRSEWFRTAHSRRSRSGDALPAHSRDSRCIDWRHQSRGASPRHRAQWCCPRTPGAAARGRVRQDRHTDNGQADSGKNTTSMAGPRLPSCR